MAQKSRPVALRKAIQIEGNPVWNEILLSLPTPECDIVFSQFTFVKLRTKEIIEESEQPIKYAYFVNSGLASVLNATADGKTVEVGLTGKEGCTGLPLAVGLKTSASQIICQVEGSAFRIPAPSLVKLFKQCANLEKKMQQYGLVMAMQGAQIAACNRLHDIDERLARWLLMCQDRIGTNVIPLTHEFVAHMLGTRRSSVTVAAGLLNKAGLITYNRGALKIENRERLEDAACECYEIMRQRTATWRKEGSDGYVR
ncbi:MAG TPA: Crp/Fnr family transcriptional regulator [Terriglobales bacterium]|jgi:CRP-like cAMP-binding protein